MVGGGCHMYVCVVQPSLALPPLCGSSGSVCVCVCSLSCQLCCEVCCLLCQPLLLLPPLLRGLGVVVVVVGAGVACAANLP